MSRVVKSIFSILLRSLSDFGFKRNMGRPFTRKPRQYSGLDLNGNLSMPMKIKREHSKIKLFGGEKIDALNEQTYAWGYKCHCGKIVGRLRMEQI